MATNITDTHVPTVGRTKTSLVTEHDRGSLAFNERRGRGEASTPADPEPEPEPEPEGPTGPTA